MGAPKNPEKYEEWKRKISEANKGNQRAKGNKLSEETKRKIAESSRGSKHMLGRKASPETRQKLSEARKGNKNALGMHHSEEAKQKMSAASRAYWTEEKRQEQGIAAKEYWTLEKREQQANKMRGNTNSLGYKFSAEARQRLSESKKGYQHSDEAKRKMSEKVKLSWSEERRLTASKAMLGNQLGLGNASMSGKRHSEVSRAKMSDSRQGNTYALGMQHSEEAKASISMSHKRRWDSLSEEDKLQQIRQLRGVARPTTLELSVARVLNKLGLVHLPQINIGKYWVDFCCQILALCWKQMAATGTPEQEQQKMTLYEMPSWEAKVSELSDYKKQT